MHLPEKEEKKTQGTQIVPSAAAQELKILIKKIRRTKIVNEY